MKRIIMLGIVLVAMLVSLGGCFWGDQGRDRGNRGGQFDSQGYDRGEGHDHDRGGGHVDDERK
jgi:hypothetical protein